MTLSRDEAARLDRALRQLPRSERRVLLLSRFEGLSHRQIAARLDLPPEAVAPLLLRALTRLRQG